MVVWGGVADRMFVTFADDGDKCARRLDRSEVAIREIEIADVAEMESRAITDIAPAMRRATRNVVTLMVVCLMYTDELKLILSFYGRFMKQTISSRLMAEVSPLPKNDF